MINLKNLLSVVLMASCVVSLNAGNYTSDCDLVLLDDSDVSVVLPISLTVSGGACMLCPLSAKSNMCGVGKEIDFYMSKANKCGTHVVAKASWVSNSKFDLGIYYDSAYGKFSKEMQGGLVGISMSGRISFGKDVISSKRDSDYFQIIEESRLNRRLYSGLGIALEGDRFKSQSGVVVQHGVSIFAINKYDAYSIMPGIDLKLFYVMNSFVISPEIFVGISVYGRGKYTVSYKNEITMTANSRFYEVISDMESAYNNLKSVKGDALFSSVTKDITDINGYLKIAISKFRKGYVKAAEDYAKKTINENVDLIKKLRKALSIGSLTNKDDLKKAQKAENSINSMIKFMKKIINSTSSVNTSIGSIETTQSLGIILHASIPISYKLSDRFGIGISLNFTWNLREEKIMNPINLSVKAKDALQDAKVTEIKANAYIHNSIGNQDLINSDTYGMAVDISNAGDPSVSDFIGILGEGRGGKVKSLSKNISGSILIHLIYINM